MSDPGCGDIVILRGNYFKALHIQVFLNRECLSKFMFIMFVISVRESRGWRHNIVLITATAQAFFLFGQILRRSSEDVFLNSNHVANGVNRDRVCVKHFSSLKKRYCFQWK